MESIQPAGSAYTQSGVNVNLGDLYSSFSGGLCRESWKNSKFVHIYDFSKGHFRGPRGWNLIELPSGSISTAAIDGIGTKTIIVDAAGAHFSSADNLIAMTAGDITRYGGMPLIFLNDLAVAGLGKDDTHPSFIAAKSLMNGLAERAQKLGYVMFGGETAELSACVSSENPDATLKFNWSGVMIGAMHPDKLINGSDVKVGDRIIALRDVTRSNGISLIRRGLRHRYGDEWYKNPSSEAQAAIKEAATPSMLYDNFFVDANGWTSRGFKPKIKIKLIAHLSGGGIKSKFGDDLLFPLGLSAIFDNLWNPPEVMKGCAFDLSVPDEECYETWGCGQGALAVVDPSDNRVERFIGLAKSYGIEARDAGLITSSEAGHAPVIDLYSGFTGKKVTLQPKK